jgi:hypothetical protein
MTRVLLLISGKNYGDISEQTDPRPVRATYLLPFHRQDVHVQTQIMRPPSHRMSHCLDSYTSILAPLPEPLAIYSLILGSDSGTGTSGLTVLFCRPTSTQSRIRSGWCAKCAATRCLNWIYGSCLSTRKVGSSDGSQFLSSKLARSNPLMLLEGLVRDDLDGKVQCCSSRSRRLRSAARCSSSIKRSKEL